MRRNHQPGPALPSSSWWAAAALLAALAMSACYEPFATPERRRVTRATHTVHFPLTSGAHTGADCDHCHGAFDTFTRFSCIGCHEHAAERAVPAHAGIAGFVYGETTCYDCHPTGEAMDRAAHDPYFPILTGDHARVACGECHPDGRPGFSCTECHEHVCTRMNDEHREVTGYRCESARCYDCHPRGFAEDD